jgi:hypothetical protein
MGMTGENWREKVQELLDVYAASLRNLSDEAVIAMHRENIKRNAVDLCELTRKELDWRGLLLDENCPAPKLS